VNVVPAGFGAAVALLKELTRHPTFKENSREEVATGAREDAESFRRGVLKVLGEELTENLLSACQNDNWGVVEALVPEIRQSVKSSQNWWSSDAFEFFATNVSQHLKPPMSGLVVLLGPDGSGKSTIADRVAEELYKQPFKICRRYEYNFRILPELKQFKRKIAGLLGREVSEAAVIGPGTKGSGMNEDHSALKGMGYVTYYALDYILGRLPLFKLRGQGALLMFARYFHDYYYQLGYGKVPKWYLRILEALVPRPDLILYLDRDADEIYRGKPELDVDEIRRQQKVIKEVVAERPYAHVIDASEGVEETVRRVKKRVEELFLRKIEDLRWKIAASQQFELLVLVRVD
jgi:thymidylate kinase